MLNDWSTTITSLPVFNIRDIGQVNGQWKKSSTTFPVEELNLL